MHIINEQKTQTLINTDVIHLHSGEFFYLLVFQFILKKE